MVRTQKSLIITDLVIAFLLLILLALPWIILLLQFYDLKPFSLSEFWWAFKNTVFQSLGSALASVVLGLFFSFGILVFPSKKSSSFSIRILLEWFCLLPNFLPCLFIVIFALSWIEPFPWGTGGIILVHAIINSGLVAVSLARGMESSIGGMTSLAFIEGATKFQLFKSIFPILKPMLYRMFIFVAVICFGSFSIPLLVGGGQGTTIEVLIYEKIKISGDWGGALSLSLIQSIIIFLLTYYVYNKINLEKKTDEPIHILKSKVSFAILAILLSFFVGAMCSEMIAGWQQVEMIPGLTLRIQELVLNTLFIGSGVGVLFILLFLLQSFILDFQIVNQIVVSWLHMSSALVGFSYLILFGSQAGIFSLIICLTSLFYPTLVRLGGLDSIQQLKSQQQMARLLGGSNGQVFIKITFPQIIERACLLAGIAALWAMGDFAVSKIIVAKEISLALLAENLLSSYRIGASFAVSGLILVLGAALFLFFRMVGHVARQKSI